MSTDAYEATTVAFGEDLADDDTPPPDSLLCSVCGQPMQYKGRGRKPKTHPECKSGTAGAAGARRTRSSSASVDAALGTLGAMYDTVTAGLMLIGLENAAKQWNLSAENLQKSNAVVLANDPGLLKAINRTAERGGKAMFIGSHIAALVPVVIVARMELAARRPAKPQTRATTPQEPTHVDMEDVLNPKFAF